VKYRFQSLPFKCNLQRYNVTAVNVDVDLRFDDGTKVRHVATKRLTHVRDFRPGHYAVRDNWVGGFRLVTHRLSSTYVLTAK
jgi:hypothetical protein